MTCTTCPLLANERAAQDTHSLFRKLRKHWKEMVSVALSICSVRCGIVITAQADLSIKIRVKVVHVGRCGKGVISITWRWYTWLARALIFILSNAQCFHSCSLSPLLICFRSPCLPDHLPHLTSGSSLYLLWNICWRQHWEHRAWSVQQWISLLSAAQNKKRIRKLVKGYMS